MSYPKMDSELKARWVEALRSGKYRRAVGALKKDARSFCCLGVLANVIDPEAWTKVDDEWLWRGYASGALTESGGLDGDEVPEIPGTVCYAAQDVLANNNDKGTPFDQQAEWIEQNL